MLTGPRMSAAPWLALTSTFSTEVSLLALAPVSQVVPST